MTNIKFDHYIVRGGMSYGRAKGSINDAFRNWLRTEHPKGDTKVEVWQVNEDAEVDGMGTLTFIKGAMKLDTFTVTKAFLAKLADVQGDIEEMLLEAHEKQDLDAEYDGIEVEQPA